MHRGRDLATHGTTATIADVVGVSVETTSDERAWIGVSLHDLVAETATGEGAVVDHGAATTTEALLQIRCSAERSP